MATGQGVRADRRPGAPPLSALRDLLGDGVTVLGICALADGRVPATLADSGGPRTGWFLETDPLVAAAAAQHLRLVSPGLSVVHADPAGAGGYAGRVPVDVVLLGPEIVDGPAPRRRGLTEALPALLRPAGHLLWWCEEGTGLAAFARGLAAAGLAESRTDDPLCGLARLVVRPRPLPAPRLYG